MDILKPKEFAERIGVSVDTLQVWDNRGILPAKRTPTNRRFYTSQDVENYFRACNIAHSGRWIVKENGKYQCSECGAERDSDDNFCGNCGARMVWDKREVCELRALKEELHG